MLLYLPTRSGVILPKSAQYDYTSTDSLLLTIGEYELTQLNPVATSATAGNEFYLGPAGLGNQHYSALGGNGWWYAFWSASGYGGCEYNLTKSLTPRYAHNPALPMVMTLTSTQVNLTLSSGSVITRNRNANWMTLYNADSWGGMRVVKR